MTPTMDERGSHNRHAASSEDESAEKRPYDGGMTRETRDAFIRDVLAATADTPINTINDNAQEAYAFDMWRWGWRG